MRLGAFGAVGLLWLSACGGVEPGVAQMRDLDFEQFQREVQPVYARSCSNPACHGNGERPLALYSPLRWRVDASRTYLVEPLSEAELRHNYDASRAMAQDGAGPGDTLLLRKPLEQKVGTYHGGGAVFLGVRDPGYQAIERWLEAGWE